MRIQHNIPALNSHRQLGANTNASSKNLEKLSSGFRINRAGDDAAGLAISEKMRGQIRGLDMASKNAQDGVSLIQTAEGALNETHSILQRMRELSVQSSNGIYDNDVDRANLDKEVTALKSELDRISTATNFNGIQLLDGSQGKDTVNGVGIGDVALGTDIAASNKVVIETSKTAGADTGITTKQDALANVNFNNAVSGTVAPKAAAKGATLTLGTILATNGVTGTTAGASTMTFSGTSLMAFSGNLSGADSYNNVYNKIEDSVITINGKELTITTDTGKEAKDGFIVLDKSKITPDPSGAALGTALGEALAKTVNEMVSAGKMVNVSATAAAGVVTLTAGGSEITGAPSIAITERGMPASTGIQFGDPDTMQDGAAFEIDGHSYVFTSEDQKDTDTTHYIKVDNLGSTANTLNSAQVAQALYDKMTEVDARYKTGTGESGIKIEMDAPNGTINLINTKKDSTITPDVKTSVHKGGGFTNTIDFGTMKDVDGDGTKQGKDLQGSTITINDGQGKEVTFEFLKAGQTAKNGNTGVILADNLTSADIATTLNAAAQFVGMNITVVGAGADANKLIIGAGGYKQQPKVEIAGPGAMENLKADFNDASKYEVGSTFAIKGADGQTSIFEFVDKKADGSLHETKTKGAVAVAFDKVTNSNNAANLLDAIQGNHGGSNSNNKLTIDEKNAFSAKGGVLVADKAKFTGSITTGGAGITPDGVESASINFGKGVKAKTTIDVNGKTFEFVNGDDAVSKEGNIAISISYKDTAEDMAQKFTDAYNKANAATDPAEKYTAAVAKNDDGSFDVKLTADTAGSKENAIKITSEFGGDNGITFQIGANGNADQRVSLNVEDMSTKGLNLSGISIATQDDANAAIDTLDKAINTVSGTRADLGALQNRLEHTINNLGVNSENLSAAESRIRDVDMAKEMMDFTKNNILTQAAQAMLAQANQQPQGVLQLLQ